MYQETITRAEVSSLALVGIVFETDELPCIKPKQNSIDRDSGLRERVYRELSRDKTEELQLAHFSVDYGRRASVSERWSRFFGQGCKWISAGAI